MATSVSPPIPTPIEKKILAESAIDQQQTAVVQPQTAVVQPQSEVNSLPVPRNEKKVYSFSQLPISIQRRIPTMKMSLHAYNRENPSASLVQLNGHILREGEMVTDQIRLDKITAEGGVLHYDGYRFLLPRHRVNNI